MVEAPVAPSVQIQGCPCPRRGGCDFYCAECYDTWEELMDEYDKAITQQTQELKADEEE